MRETAREREKDGKTERQRERGGGDMERKRQGERVQEIRRTRGVGMNIGQQE